MTTELKIGTTVTAPVTDKDGETTYVIGKLIDLNKRYATIERDSETFKVGKTKVEPVEEEKKSSGEKSNVAQAVKPYRPLYEKVVASSGRKSLDNGDEVAQLLRGLTLPEVYEIVAEHLEMEVKDLGKRYEHLNPGQQRMNLGNKLRGHFRKLEKDSEE